MSGPEPLLRAMLGSLVLQLVSMSMFVTLITAKGQADDCDLDCHQRPYGYLRAMLPWEGAGDADLSGLSLLT